MAEAAGQTQEHSDRAAKGFGAGCLMRALAMVSRSTLVQAEEATQRPQPVSPAQNLKPLDLASGIA